MSTYGDLHRDVVSALGTPKEQINFKDVSNAINQTISQARVEYIQNGQGYEFVETETFYVLIDDLTYPFLYSTDLDKNLMRTLPISQTVRSSLFWKTENELLDEAQTWSEGDIVRKGDYAYQALDDISSTNTYNLTFTLENPRNYYIDNGLKYVKGDIVRDQVTGDYYRCDTAYTNNQGQSITASGNFTKVLWKQIGEAFFEATYVPFDAMYEMKLRNNIKEHYPFTILDNKIYTTVENVPFSISYIPEWTFVEDMSTELNIPDSMYQSVRNRAIQLLAPKLGMEQPQTDEE